MSMCPSCGGELMHAASLPPIAACSRCGQQLVGSALGIVPPCPSCGRALQLVIGQLPIRVRCDACACGFFFDAASATLSSCAGYGPVWPPPPCPTCGGKLSMPEDPPPRANCSACKKEFPLGPGGLANVDSSAKRRAGPGAAPSASATDTAASPSLADRTEGFVERALDTEWIVWVLGALAALIVLAILGAVIWLLVWASARA